MLFRSQKTLFFDPSAKVPLIIKWPGQYRSGVQVDDPAGLIDLFPTLCCAAEAEIQESCSGVDLTPLLKEGKKIDRDAIFCESSALKHPEHSGCMIRTAQYKFALYLDGQHELYDMRSDPGEWHNLSGHAELKEIEADLARRVRDFWHPDEQIDRYNRCPAMQKEKHFYLFSNQFIGSDGRVTNARP